MCWEEQERPHEKMPFVQRGGEPGRGLRAERAVRRLQAGSIPGVFQGPQGGQ